MMFLEILVSFEVYVKLSRYLTINDEDHGVAYDEGIRDECRLAVTNAHPTEQIQLI